MRRTAGLFARIVSFENLYAAAHATLRGKRGTAAAGTFFLGLEHELLCLQRELVRGEYQPGGYRTFWIRDPKQRLISAAPFRDRVVHHALVRVIEPLFERRFIHHSYACRTGKGTHRALRQFVAWVRSSRYVLKLDIRKFFPTIDHEILKAQIRRTIKDAATLSLCDVVIDGSNEQEQCVQHFPGDDLLTPTGRRKGIPIGNLTSQFFANVHLDALDHFVKEELRVPRYLRYVDDFCCCGDDKVALREVRAAIAAYLMGLRLRLNDGKSRLRQVKEGVEFLGFVVFPEELRLSQTAVRRERRRLRSQRTGLLAGTETTRSVRRSFEAWSAHAAQGTTWRLRRAIGRP
jgi:retron-type reverse transcriptase